jgi:hypothetical protein
MDRWGNSRCASSSCPAIPDGSYLITKIAPPTDAPCQDPTHHRRMPPDPLAPLSAEAIATVVQWISEGRAAELNATTR